MFPFFVWISSNTYFVFIFLDFWPFSFLKQEYTCAALQDFPAPWSKGNYHLWNIQHILWLAWVKFSGMSRKRAWLLCKYTKEGNFRGWHNLKTQKKRQDEEHTQSNFQGKFADKKKFSGSRNNLARGHSSQWNYTRYHKQQEEQLFREKEERIS